MVKVTDKYSMTIEQNVFIAKRNIVDYIWKSAKLEGLSVTYPDTDAIYNGAGVQGIPVSEIIAINNLKRAWEFVLSNIEPPLNYAYFCKINQLIGGDNLINRAGFIRNVPVSVGGTTWKPDMPIESIIKEEIADISTITEATDRSITYMLWTMRRQMFLDGNKRTAQLVGNKEMIAHGAGIISIPIEEQREFISLLIDYYETNEMDRIKSFVYEFCIDGIDLSRGIECER